MGKSNIVSFFKSVQMTVSRHSPEILTGIGIAGMITTTVLAVAATPKAVKLLEMEQERREEDGSQEPLTKVDVVKTCWKCYIPATVTGVASISCLIGASAVNARRNAALAAAYKLSETALSEYKEKVIETIGERKEQTIKDKIAEDRMQKDPISKSEIIVTKSGNTRCYDYISKRYFISDRDKLEKIENELNRRMLHDIYGYVSLNELYEEIGLPPVEYGDNLGWNTDALISFDLGAHLADDGEPCLLLDHNVAPKYNFMRF